MAKFHFRLQSWYQIKEKLERQKEIEYGLAVAALNRELRRMEELREERAECLGEFQRKVSKRIDPLSLQKYNDYLDVMKKRIKAQEIEIVKAREYVARKQKELVKAMQERKAIEKLRERAMLEHKENEKRQEARSNDEVVTYMYAGKGKDL
jgi:flagellar FliJ protein